MDEHDCLACQCPVPGAPHCPCLHRGDEFHCEICGSTTHDTMVHEGVPARVPETYTVAQIRFAFEKHASPDSWGVPAFYEKGLLAALRGEYDDPIATLRDRVSRPADSHVATKSSGEVVNLLAALQRSVDAAKADRVSRPGHTPTSTPEEGNR